MILRDICFKGDFDIFESFIDEPMFFYIRNTIYLRGFYE